MKHNAENISFTILVDNYAKDGLIQEHGFALWIEAYGKQILFDTGQGNAFLHNVSHLGINLSSADFLILSHGHYDHFGNISSVLQINPEIQIYCHAGAFVPRYSIPQQSSPKVISIPQKEAEAMLNHPHSKVHWVTSPITIENNIGIISSIPRTHPLEDVGGSFYLDTDKARPDPITDELALWINTKDGLVLVTGCCHAGLINTIEYTRAVTGNRPIRAVVGGLHLLHASEKRIAATVQALQSLNIRTLIPCHCTGDHAIDVMANSSIDVRRGYAGLQWNFHNSKE